MPFDLAQTFVDQWPHALARQSICRLREFLESQGTFRFPALSSGLFSAAAFDSQESEVTGYQSVWTRDTVHVSHALWGTGQVAPAVRAMTSLGEFYVRSRHRFLNIIAQPELAADPMQRPHVRFNGNTLSELPEKWSHAQNDALGYWLWLTSRMILKGDLPCQTALAEVLGLLVQYWKAIQFWQDEDSGHWEEARKIEASSIGIAVAGLTAFREVLQQQAAAFDETPALVATVDRLLTEGQRVLAQILPGECQQDNPAQHRLYDAALLFLIYPAEVVTDDIAAQIISNVKTHLLGPVGIRRYNGDSYWCANYKKLLSAEVRTSDFSDDLASRDRLLVPGTEAQWCIFDPILSVIHAQRFLKHHDHTDKQAQHYHLQRSLRQLTSATSRFGVNRCPESYYLEGDQWVPNDICPLLWTQANLLLALQWAELTAE